MADVFEKMICKLHIWTAVAVFMTFHVCFVTVGVVHLRPRHHQLIRRHHNHQFMNNFGTFLS